MAVRIQSLLDWYATLTPETLAQINRYYAANATFKDPFNEVEGHEAIRHIFEHMFETTTQPRFVISRCIEQDNDAFVTWRFDCTLRGKSYSMLGATHFVLDGNGMVLTHRDYWDPAEELWQKLPILGPLVRWLRRQFKA